MKIPNKFYIEVTLEDNERANKEIENKVSTVARCCLLLRH